MLSKQVTLKILEYSQESTCTGAFFNKAGLKFFIKKKTSAQVFSCEYCEIFRKNFCYIKPVTAFDLTQLYTLND